MPEHRHGRPFEQAFQHADNAGHAGSLDASGGVDKIGSRRGARGTGPRESRCGPRSAGARPPEHPPATRNAPPRGQTLSPGAPRTHTKKENSRGPPTNDREATPPPTPPNTPAT